MSTKKRSDNNFSKNSKPTIASNTSGVWGHLSWAGTRVYCKSGASMWTLRLITSARPFWVAGDGPAPGLASALQRMKHMKSFSLGSNWPQSVFSLPPRPKKVLYCKMTKEVFISKKKMSYCYCKKTPHNNFFIKKKQSSHNKQALSGKREGRLLQRVCVLGSGQRVFSRSAQQKKNVQDQYSRQVK